jgi:MFS family permease
MRRESSTGLRILPRDVWALGFVSMFMDVSSELVHSLLPVFMATTLGAGMVAIGLIEGVAEATAAITKVFSGVLSDHWRKRKNLLISGYGLAACTKPIFPLASSLGWVFAARFIDRIGKGIRGAPRDALIADITHRSQRGAAYGLRQSLDTVGAFCGPLLALVLMSWFRGDIRSVLWISVIPAVASVFVLAIAVREPAPLAPSAEKRGIRLAAVDVKRLGHGFWIVVFLGGVLTLARFSEAFLLLRSQDVGLSPSEVPITLVIMNVVYALASYPAGRAADRIDQRVLLSLGTAVLILADLLLARAVSIPLALGGAAIWGLHMGLTQGVLSSLVAAVAPEKLRGTAFGVFNLATGVLMLVSSLIAGILWNRYGPSATFAASGAFSVITLIGLLLYRPQKASAPVSSGISASRH